MLKKAQIALTSTAVLLAACAVTFNHAEESAAEAEPKEEWIQLFNGEDMTGWTPKFKGYDLGENPGDTFRVEDGVLKVAYDSELYNDGYKSLFGHLFCDTPYSHYRLRVEYRFVGEQCKGGPGWAFANNGLMLHGQDPATMTKDQSFPASIEVQLRGSNDKHKNNNLFIFTPGTWFETNDGELIKSHGYTKFKNPAGTIGQWQTVEIIVKGNDSIEHTENGKSVISYKKPQFDPTWGATGVKGEEAKAIVDAFDGKLQIVGGSISLQAESHPTEFRKIELLPLEGNVCEYKTVK